MAATWTEYERMTGSESKREREREKEKEREKAEALINLMNCSFIMKARATKDMSINITFFFIYSTLFTTVNLVCYLLTVTICA